METILIFFGIYLAAYLILNLLAIRYRKRLVVAVDKAKTLTANEKMKVGLDTFTLSMISMRTSVILLLIFGQMLLEPKEKLMAVPDFDEGEFELFESGLMREILECHMASAAAANPLFGALAYVVRLASHLRFRAILGEQGEFRETHSVSARYSVC